MKKLIHGSVVALGLLVAGAALPPGADAQSKKPSSPDSKPKFSAPSPPKAEPPKTEKPKFSAPPEKKADAKAEKPKFSAPDKSKADPPKGSSKPVTAGDTSEKARAAKEARSEAKFKETQKAVAPPKPKFTTPDGKEVVVRAATKDAEAIRNMPSTNLRPEVRVQNTTVHITQYNYRHDYQWYHTQPVVYVGGGYSSAFWYMMGEWDAERRARWLYHHRYDIEQSAYERGLRDARVAAELDRLERLRASRDPNYLDPEFKADPSICYTDDYVQAVYNPAVEEGDDGAALAVFLWLGSVALLGLIGWGVYALVFKVRWG